MNINDAKRIVFKFGTNVLRNDDKEISLSRVYSFIEEISKLHRQGKEIIIVTSGAVGLGSKILGVDSSESMLAVASSKSEDQKILYLNQDMCDFELFGTVDVFISMLDSVNYITEPESFDKMLSLVKNYLNPEGIFIFDVNSKFKFENVLMYICYLFTQF